MPTVMRIGAFRFYFFSHEPNQPPHVHVDRDEATMKVWLNSLEIAKSRGFRAHELSGIVATVADNQAKLLEAWHDYFG